MLWRKSAPAKPELVGVSHTVKNPVNEELAPHREVFFNSAIRLAKVPDPTIIFEKISQDSVDFIYWVNFAVRGVALSDRPIAGKLNIIRQALDFERRMRSDYFYDETGKEEFRDNYDVTVLSDWVLKEKFSIDAVDTYLDVFGRLQNQDLKTLAFQPTVDLERTLMLSQATGTNRRTV